MSERPEEALEWTKYYAPTQSYEDISNYITQLEAENKRLTAKLADVSNVDFKWKLEEEEPQHPGY